MRIRVKCRRFIRPCSPYGSFKGAAICGWVGYRVAGSIKPCPKCGGCMPAAEVW